LPSTDVLLLQDPSLHSFPHFQALSTEISEHEGLAQLVIASLVVRRDYRLRDYHSILSAGSIFDQFAPAMARAVHRNVRRQDRLRADSEKGVVKWKQQAAARHKLIEMELDRLDAQKTPRRHWGKLTAAALKKQGHFPHQSDDALIRAVQKVARTRR
jgi:hypothetical protein